jgi:hypothetical protein
VAWSCFHSASQKAVTLSVLRGAKGKSYRLERDRRGRFSGSPVACDTSP